MKPYFVQATVKTPEISIDYDESVIKVAGRAMSDNCADFFAETVENIRSNMANMPKALTFVVQLEYCNSQCSKGLYKLMVFLRDNHTLPMKVEWRYELDDDFVLDLGQELEKMSGEKFNFKGI